MKDEIRDSENWVVAIDRPAANPTYIQMRGLTEEPVVFDEENAAKLANRINEMLDQIQADRVKGKVK